MPLAGAADLVQTAVHVDDLADACIFVSCLPKKVYASHTRPNLSQLNVGTGEDLTIRELAYDTDGLSASGMDIDAWLKRYGARHVGGGPAASLVDMDCLLCHATPP